MSTLFLCFSTLTRNNSCNSSFHKSTFFMPIWGSGSSVPVNTTDAVNIIISNRPSERISRAVPVYVKHYVAFLVDISALIDWRDVRTDLVGGLARSGTKSFYFDIDKENHAINTSEDDATHVAKRYTYKHKPYPDFHKIVISLSENGSCSPFNLFYCNIILKEMKKTFHFHTHMEIAKEMNLLRRQHTQFEKKSNP